MESTPPAGPWTCAEAFSRLDDFLDRELTATEIAAVRDHLAVCAGCAAEFRFEESVLRNVRAKIARIAFPPEVEAAVWKVLQIERSKRSR